MKDKGVWSNLSVFKLYVLVPAPEMMDPNSCGMDLRICQGKGKGRGRGAGSFLESVGEDSWFGAGVKHFRPA